MLRLHGQGEPYCVEESPPGSRREGPHINFDFTADQAFAAFEFVATGVVFEVDSMVVGLTNRVTNIAEPGLLALFAAGLFGVVVVTRRQRKT